jgi:hypothetical protein
MRLCERFARPKPDQASRGIWFTDARSVITTDFDVGVWLSSATLLLGTSTFASGK